MHLWSLTDGNIDIRSSRDWLKVRKWQDWKLHQSLDFLFSPFSHEIKKYRNQQHQQVWNSSVCRKELPDWRISPWRGREGNQAEHGEDVEQRHWGVGKREERKVLIFSFITPNTWKKAENVLGMIVRALCSSVCLLKNSILEQTLVFKASEEMEESSLLLAGDITLSCLTLLGWKETPWRYESLLESGQSPYYVDLHKPKTSLGLHKGFLW